MKVLIIVLVVLGSIGAAGYFGFIKLQHAAIASVDACVSLAGNMNALDVVTVDCDSADATYVVAGEGDDCDKEEVTIEVPVLGSDDAERCLAFNANRGDCFRFGNESRPDVKVGCKGFQRKPRVAKVVKVADDTAYAECPAPNDLKLSNLTRSSTICLRGLG